MNKPEITRYYEYCTTCGMVYVGRNIPMKRYKKIVKEAKKKCKHCFSFKK